MIAAAERVSEVLSRFTERLKSRKLHDLEHLVTERFQHLVCKPGLVERIEIDGDSFALALLDGRGGEVERQRLSAGEQQLLAVAFLWALADASGRHLPVLIDTPLGRMDSLHRSNLVERYLPHVSHQVVLFSTDMEIDRGFHQRLTELGALDHSLRVVFDPEASCSSIQEGYFW